MWWLGASQDQVKRVEALSISNLKRTWVNTQAPDWFDVATGAFSAFLEQAVQVKNVWVPYGV